MTNRWDCIACNEKDFCKKEECEIVDRPSEYAHYPDDCEYFKLVRDRVPQIVEAAGLVPVHRKIESMLLMLSLIHKVIEEAEEVLAELNHQTDGERLESELGDLFEVVYAIEEHFPKLMEQAHVRRLNKKASHGGFSDGIFLERTESKS